MALKNLLSTSLVMVFILLSCTERKEKKAYTDKKTQHKIENDSFAVTEKTVLTDSVNEIGQHTILQKNQQTKTEDKEIIVDKSTEPTVKDFVHNGIEYIPNELYIIAPENRITDSITLFVHNYDRLMRTLTKQGIGNAGKEIENPIERDSLLWEHWQKVILDNDYRHTYQPYNREYKWGDNK